MRYAIAPKVAVVEADEADEEVAVVSSHQHATDIIRSYKISPNDSLHTEG
jgi:hypothetical protein